MTALMHAAAVPYVIQRPQGSPYLITHGFHLRPLPIGPNGSEHVFQDEPKVLRTGSVGLVIRASALQTVDAESEEDDCQEQGRRQNVIHDFIQLRVHWVRHRPVACVPRPLLPW